MELYRVSAAGVSLTEVLNTMISEGDLPVAEAVKVLESFDRNFERILRNNLLIQKEILINDAQGKLSNYNSYEGVWRVDVQEFSLQLGDFSRKYERARILCREK